MNEEICTFFAGSAGDWANTIVTLLTGAAVAAFAYQANKATAITKREAREDSNRRARAFGQMISVEVGSAQSFLYNVRKGLSAEIDLARIPNVDEIRRLQKSLDIDFLPSVRLDYASVHYLPESCASPLLSGLAAIDNVRRTLKITVDSLKNIDANNILTPTGMENIERVCHLIGSAEVRFRDAHRALWEFNFKSLPLTEWQYPVGADVPNGIGK